MLDINLLRDVEISRVANDAVAGTADVVTSAVDMSGWGGVIFVAALGDVTAGSVLSLGVQECDTSGGSYSPVTGTTGKTAGASDCDNNLLLVDATKPTKQFVQGVLKRGTQNAVVDGILAIKYGPLHRPVTQGATVIGALTLPNASA